jgi:hypothetical protein
MLGRHAFEQLSGELVVVALQVVGDRDAVCGEGHERRAAVGGMGFPRDESRGVVLVAVFAPLTARFYGRA